MIETFALRGDRIVQPKPGRFGKKLVWVRCVKPRLRDLNVLSRISKIPVDEFEESMSEEERPKISVDKYMEIIYRAPYKVRDGIITVPMYVYIKGKLLITIEKRPYEPLTYLSEFMKKNKYKFLFRKPMGYFIFFILDKVNDDFLAQIDKIALKVDTLEGKGSFSEEHIEHIYDSSITLTHFNNALLANLEVLNSLRKSYFRPFNALDRRRFAELYFDVLQIIDTEKIQRETITHLFDLQSVIVSNRLNIFMKRLTSIMAIIMIPTLISGIYGMNFMNLPLKHHDYGFFIMLGIMFLISIMLILLFKFVDWL
jgi:magnesium transporter